MPRSARTQKSEVGGRERLLAAATRLFAARGYAATSVRDILKAARVTAPVLYYHFGSKEGLFVGLLTNGLEMLEAELDRALSAATTPAERVLAYCRAHVTVQRKNPDLRWIAESLASGPPKAAPRFDILAIFAGGVTRLAGLVSAAVESGELRPCDPVAAALALLGAVEMTVRARLIEARIPALAEPDDGVIAAVLDGLRTPHAEAPPVPGRARQR